MENFCVNSWDQQITEIILSGSFQIVTLKNMDTSCNASESLIKSRKQLNVATSVEEIRRTEVTPDLDHELLWNTLITNCICVDGKRTMEDLLNLFIAELF